eukprot:3552110-Rhodomonas_salina.2
MSSADLAYGARQLAARELHPPQVPYCHTVCCDVWYCNTYAMFGTAFALHAMPGTDLACLMLPETYAVAFSLRVSALWYVPTLPIYHVRY